MRWRRTSDLDLVIAVEREALPAGLDAQDGWTRDPRNEQEWHGPGGVRVDIIPAGGNLLAVGFLEWESGQRMSLAGMRHALSTSLPTPIGGDVAIPVAPLHTLALLKTIAYLDRPLDRERDLEDLAYILEEYVDVDDERRYSEVVPPELEFEARPAFLLGYDLAPLLDAGERRSVDDFARLALGEADDPTTSRLLRNGPPR